MSDRVLELGSRSGLFAGLLVISLLFVTGTTVTSIARLEGEMVGEVWLAPLDPNEFFGSESRATWKADYVDGEIADLPGRIREILFWPNTRLADTGLAISGQMESGLVKEDFFGLSLDGYLAREFGPDYPIGTLGGGTRVRMGSKDLEYWVNKGIVNYGGFSYSGIFLLEKAQSETSYSSGLELSVSGTKISGLAVELTARFGMYPDPAELVAGTEGSGYDVFDPLGGRIDGYTGSEIIIQGVTLGSARFDSTTKFSSKQGFESTSLEFTLEEASDLFRVDGSIKYSPEEKSISLTPRLDLNFACFDVYSRFSPEGLTNSSAIVNGLSIDGYGIEKIQLGDVRVGLLQALGKETVSRPPGKYDYELRASDYTFPPPGEKAFYKETDYTGVLSISGGAGNLNLASDFYWGGGSNLFGLTNLTGEAEYRLSESFELITGLAISLTDGVQDIVVNTIYRW